MTKKYWQDYFFLTNEVEKCVMRQDFDMLNELLMQREKIQQSIDDSQDKSYIATTEGRDLLHIIAAKNSQIKQQLHMLRNQSEKNHAVANAYDRLGMGTTGYRMDSKT